MRRTFAVIVTTIGMTATAMMVMAESLRVGTFAVDATPPIGSPLAYVPTKEITLPLSCRGIVLRGNGQPVVLCAVDWIGIGNDSQKEFRRALAEAAGTTVERVTVHTLHQHDAPHCDFSADRLLATYGINSQFYNAPFSHEVIRRAAEALRRAVEQMQPVTQIGLGQAEVKQVASNRRILGPDGKVQYTRWTACTDPKIRAMPVGTIDPLLKLISFWNEQKPVVVLTYYATHPQSYYRTGGANPDFPGMARNMRQEAMGVLHVHFNGAGGNVGAGKWNDGSHENRQVLADRVAAGMKEAWETQKKTTIAAEDLGWRSMPVLLPVAEHLDEAELSATLADREAAATKRAAAASNLVWLHRCQEHDPIDVSCLRLGRVRVLHLPGELFVEYQLAAQRMRPNLFVAMAAYSDYAPGYIGTEIAYSQGGYEASPRASRVAPTVESILSQAIAQLLKD